MTECCSTCGAAIVAHSSVYFGSGGESRLLCLRCYNESMAKRLDLDYEHIEFDPVTLEGHDGLPHTFEFRSRIFGEQLALEAHEVTENEEGYEISVIADAEQDLYVTFQSLFERIRRELSRQHLEFKQGYYHIKDGMVRGHITSSAADDHQAPLLVIDGKPIRWEEFGRMVSTYMGFRFKMELFDLGEDK